MVNNAVEHPETSANIPSTSHENVASPSPTQMHAHTQHVQPRGSALDTSHNQPDIDITGNPFILQPNEAPWTWKRSLLFHYIPIFLHIFSILMGILLLYGCVEKNPNFILSWIIYAIIWGVIWIITNGVSAFQGFGDSVGTIMNVFLVLASRVYIFLLVYDYWETLKSDFQE